MEQNAASAPAVKNNNAGEDIDPLLLKGVSVHYLQNDFLEEVEAAGLDMNTTNIYDLEPNLKTAICPRDHQMGAAYVDTIEQSEDNVGISNIMLSYTWAYTVKDIVSTLTLKCKEDGRDPKRTYIWICCLCNNQHRISADNVLSSFDEFRKTLYDTMTRVGRVWSMMNPIYLQRVWCIFEFYIASTTEGIVSEIIIPNDHREDAMIESLEEDIDNLFNALSNIKIENAKATKGEDKGNILALVHDTIGFDEFNDTMKILLRNWIASTLMAEVHKKREGEENSIDIEYATKLIPIAEIFDKMGSSDVALNLLQECLEIREKALGKEHPDTATIYNTIGCIMHRRGDYDYAFSMFTKALAINEKALGKDNIATSSNYSNIGGVLDAKGDYDGALVMYNKSLLVKWQLLGKDHPSTATTYSNIGSVLYNKGDYDDAFTNLTKCLAINEKTLGKDHPETAITYDKMGGVMDKKGDYDGALSMYTQCLTIREESLGKDHPSTAATYNNMGLALKNKGDYADSLDMYSKSLSIYEKTLGTDHPSIASIYSNIGSVMYIKGDHDDALDMFQKSLIIREKSLGKDHSDTVNTNSWISKVMKAKRQEVT